MKKLFTKGNLIVLLICFFLIWEFCLVREEVEEKGGSQEYQVQTEAPHNTEKKKPDEEKGQMAILEGAREYVKIRPVYRSKYYQGGYPDDRYGVCTDVVGMAFQYAGYDLMQMVSDDIQKNPQCYGITTPDRNIDFRRVKNLDVFFSRYAQTLSTDITDVEAWQGGDIVVFDDHIGIVSDKRNKKGIPYVIHHSKSFQWNYEQDILEKRNDLVAHYRFPG